MKHVKLLLFLKSASVSFLSKERSLSYQQKKTALGEGEEMASRHVWCVGCRWSFSWAPSQWTFSLVQLPELTENAWEHDSCRLDATNCIDKMAYLNRCVLTIVFVTGIRWRENLMCSWYRYMDCKQNLKIENSASIFWMSALPQSDS